MNGICSIVWTTKTKIGKCVVQLIEQKSLNCLNNKTQIEENVVFNQLNNKHSIVWTTKTKKGKSIVQSIEWQTFNCLNNENKKKKVCFSINWTTEVQLFEQRQQKEENVLFNLLNGRRSIIWIEKTKIEKCVVQSIERQTFNCLNNENKKRKMCCSINWMANVQLFEQKKQKEENVMFNQLNDKRSIV